MLKLVSSSFCCTGIWRFTPGSVCLLPKRLDWYKPCFIQLFTMLIITSQVMLAELYQCMTIVPDCISLSVSFKCLCRFYNSLHLPMCDCEDLVPAQELKGTSLSSPVLDSRAWEDKKNPTKTLLNLFWNCKVCIFEDCASQVVKKTRFVLLKMILAKEGSTDMYNEHSFVFVFFKYIIYKKYISVWVLRQCKGRGTLCSLSLSPLSASSSRSDLLKGNLCGQTRIM